MNQRWTVIAEFITTWTDWLIDSVVRSINWLIGWWIDWLIDEVTVRLINWLIDILTVPSIDWLIDWWLTPFVGGVFGQSRSFHRFSSRRVLGDPFPRVSPPGNWQSLRRPGASNQHRLYHGLYAGQTGSPRHSAADDCLCGLWAWHECPHHPKRHRRAGDHVPGRPDGAPGVWHQFSRRRGGPARHSGGEFPARDQGAEDGGRGGGVWGHGGGGGIGAGRCDVSGGEDWRMYRASDAEECARDRARHASPEVGVVSVRQVASNRNSCVLQKSGKSTSSILQSQIHSTFFFNSPQIKSKTIHINFMVKPN